MVHTISNVAVGFISKYNLWLKDIFLGIVLHSMNSAVLTELHTMRFPGA